MPRKKPKKVQPEVNEALKGFDIRINEFGEIVSNLEVERLNEFLDHNLEDKKLAEKQPAKPEEPAQEKDKDQ